MVNPIIIAIDGPSASGKGTIARKIAEKMGFAYLDTGLLYRAVGMAVIHSGGDPSDPVAAERSALALKASEVTSGHNEILRSDQASVAASKVAAIPAVRAALLKFQKDFCAAPPHTVLGATLPGAVLDGRDIGTVIAPHAAVKLFVTATAEVRATRRFHELQARGIVATYAEVLADMHARDARDAERAIAPSRPADDAQVLDTTDLSADQALVTAMEMVQEKLAGVI